MCVDASLFEVGCTKGLAFYGVDGDAVGFAGLIVSKKAIGLAMNTAFFALAV